MKRGVIFSLFFLSDLLRKFKLTRWAGDRINGLAWGLMI